MPNGMYKKDSSLFLKLNLHAFVFAHTDTHIDLFVFLSLLYMYSRSSRVMCIHVDLRTYALVGVRAFGSPCQFVFESA